MRLTLAVTCHFISFIYAYAISRGNLDHGGVELDRSPLASSNFSKQQLEVPLVLTGPLGLDPYSDKPRIGFKEDGSFKLTIFSDIHFGENPWDSWGPEQDINTTALMETLLDVETPDYVIINGDLITGEDTFRENSTCLIDEIVRPLNAAKIPFSSTSGNHDSDINITRAEEIAREMSISPLSYTRMSPPGVGGVGGPGNYWVPVYQNTGDHAPALVLWFFDSRGGKFQNGRQMPDWVDSSVANWIKSETQVMNNVWGPPEQRSALAFVHIPPHVIQAVQKSLNSSINPGLNADTLGQGSTQASIDPAWFGKDHDFWHSLNTNVKNLRAVVSGHDHGNEWCAREPTYAIIFCFNKHSGYGGYSGPNWGMGVRSLVFHSAAPLEGIETYIMMKNGTTHARRNGIVKKLVLVFVQIIGFVYVYQCPSNGGTVLCTGPFTAYVNSMPAVLFAQKPIHDQQQNAEVWSIELPAIFTLY